MGFKQLLFPEESRGFPGKRWLNVILRSIHLCGVGVYTGGIFYGIESSVLIPSYLVTALSGLLIMGSDLYSNFKWIFQNRGFLIILKLIMLGVLPHLPDYQKWGLIIVIVFSSIISHGTANFRYYSLFHRKQI